MDLKDNGGKQLQLLGLLVLVWELCWQSVTKHKLEKNSCSTHASETKLP